jgi:hypothetical protein
MAAITNQDTKPESPGFSIEQVAGHNAYLVRVTTRDESKSLKFTQALINLRTEQPNRVIIDLRDFGKKEVDEQKNWVICSESFTNITGIPTRYLGVSAEIFDKQSYGGRPSYSEKISKKIASSLEEALR